MAHKKSKKVYWCHTIQNYIMASHCNNCGEVNFYGECPRGKTFNDCKIISENNKKDIDKALK